MTHYYINFVFTNFISKTNEIVTESKKITNNRKIERTFVKTFKFTTENI